MTMWKPAEPYNALPPPPSMGLETVRTLKAAIAAHRALAQLNQALVLIPNPMMLVNAVALLEAQASSEIENIVTTTDALYLYQNDVSGSDAATRETLRYRAALWAGFVEMQKRTLTAATALVICSEIKGREMQIRSLPGTRIGNTATGEIIYSPSEGSDCIIEKLSDWEKYLHAEDGLDSLIRMAVAHYQFEAIHPFADGNDRTGRIISVLYLVHAGLLRLPVLYLSKYFINSKQQYYQLLREVTAKHNWEEWILYVLKGIEQTSSESLLMIEAIEKLRSDFASRMQQVSRGGARVEFQTLLFEQPYCRIKQATERCGVSRPTATKWLTELSVAGMLQEKIIGRDRIFINHELITLLHSSRSSLA